MEIKIECVGEDRGCQDDPWAGLLYSGGTTATGGRAGDGAGGRGLGVRREGLGSSAPVVVFRVGGDLQ